MHWTLQIMMWLCGICFVLNTVQCITVGSVRISDLFICYAWALQQMIWMAYDFDSTPVMLICDAGLAYVIWHYRTVVLDCIVLYILPLTTLCTLFQWFNGGHTTTSWWINWSLVTVQMVIGLPYITRQKARTWCTHGPKRLSASI